MLGSSLFFIFIACIPIQAFDYETKKALELVIRDRIIQYQ